MAETRSKLRHEEDRLHEVRTHVLSLEARVSEKAAEVERPAHPQDTEALAERRSEREQTKGDLRALDGQLSELRKVLAQQRGKTEAEQEKLQAAQAEAVCPYMPGLGCGLQAAWFWAPVVAAAAARIDCLAALIIFACGCPIRGRNMNPML